MSITRLQQARQMYAMGQRVAKTLDGSRPGYRGSDYGDEARGTGAYSGGDSSPAAGGTQGGGTGSGNQNTGGGSTDDRSSALQTFNTQKATGQINNDAVFTGSLNNREKVLQNFYNTRPKVNIPNIGLSGMFLNLFNKGVNSPIQKFADFTTKKNRSFFENVIRAGKIPGLDFGTVADMTPEQLEASYQSYMDNRMSGATDAYGNPNIVDQLGRDNNNQGIATLYNYNMFDDTEENANDPFASRFLQNQPDDIREEIESRMQNYYTV